MQVKLDMDDVTISLGNKGVTLKIADNEENMSAAFVSAKQPSNGGMDEHVKETVKRSK